MLADSLLQAIAPLAPSVRDAGLHTAAVAALRGGDWQEITAALLGLQDDLLSQGRVADPGNQIKASRRVTPMINAALTQLTTPRALETLIGRIDAMLAAGSANQSLYLYRGTAALLAGRRDIYDEIFNDRLIRSYDLRDRIRTADFAAFCDALLQDMERIVTFRPIGGACPTSDYSHNMVGARSDRIAEYNAAVLDCFRDYSRQSYGSDLVLQDGELEGYTVRLYNGESLGEHIHPTSWLTCASYVRIPPLDPAEPLDGAILFAAPDKAGQTTVYQAYRPELGKILIFPAYLPHRTLPVMNRQERVSSNYDVYRKPAGFPPASKGPA